MYLFATEYNGAPQAYRDFIAAAGALEEMGARKVAWAVAYARDILGEAPKETLAVQHWREHWERATEEAINDGRVLELAGQLKITAKDNGRYWDI